MLRIKKFIFKIVESIWKPIIKKEREGFLDIINNKVICGWAWDPNYIDKAVKIDIYDYNHLIATIVADLYREDLKRFGKGNGYHSFLYIIPEELKNEQEHLFHVKHHGSDIELYHSPQLITLKKQNFKQKINSVEEFRKILTLMLDKPLWKVEQVQISNEYLEILGWALAPGEDYDSVSFMINDSEFDIIEYPLKRNDIGSVFWYLPYAATSGFHCKINIKETLDYDKMVFRHVNKTTKKSFYHYYDIHYPSPIKNTIKLPSGERIERVHGNQDETTFYTIGYSVHQNFRSILKNLLNKDYMDFSNILDWGCGCGRITRYFDNLSNSTTITGIDVDDDSVEWCKNNLNFSNFQSIPLHPPTKLQNSYFDLVIGNSIFTHLKENVQFEWLEELQRITAEGAILLVTVHNSTAICRLDSQSSFIFDLWKNYGFADAGANSAINNVIIDHDYYRSVFHSSEYIIKNWSQYFKIIAIIPGASGNHQDVVVMQKIEANVSER